MPAAQQIDLSGYDYKRIQRCFEIIRRKSCNPKFQKIETFYISVSRRTEGEIRITFFVDNLKPAQEDIAFILDLWTERILRIEGL